MNAAIINCEICNKTLTGKQKLFCSTTCKHKSSNNKFQNYKAQRERGLSRKLEMIKIKGNKCILCGYDKNIHALCFHHKDPSTKMFQLDLKNLSNRTWESILLELEKCSLLCSNCHLEHHNPY